jgi:eukaryotic-like serine/threonine-protein kinase
MSTLDIAEPLTGYFLSLKRTIGRRRTLLCSQDNFMPRRFICRHDHEWEASLAPGDVLGTNLACPVCGVTDFTCLQEESKSGEPTTGYAPPLPGSSVVLPRVPGHDVLAELGHGGMGIVYKAFDRRRRQLVALKKLQGLTPAALYRFKKEFHTLAEVTHPNLITLFESISDGTNWFFTMELIDGVSFLTHVRGSDFVCLETIVEDAAAARIPAPPAARAGPGQSAEQIVRLREALRQLADAVAALHEAGKLHRDIKPGNVLVSRQGRVVLLDFGLAADLGPTGHHVSSQRHLVGTIRYMSPEQMVGQPLTTSSDWYSVGVMLYECLTGRLPFEGDFYTILEAKQERDPLPPSRLAGDVPEDLETLCIQLLQRRSEDRPSGQDILHRLRGLAAPAHDAVASSSAAPFLGRQRHLASLDESFEAVCRGQTRTVLIAGPSGMGKTTLVRHFLDRLLAQPNVVVLMGRCFERESVPYKALDSLVDALSGYLRRLPDKEVLGLLPRDAALLGRVFPMLRRVPAIDEAPRRGADLPDAAELRGRAFAALRELLGRLGDRRRPVLFIDDLQWGDLDSGLLLAELVRPPDAPALLLLGGYRSENGDASPCVRALRELGHQADSAAEHSELTVDALDPVEARNLARALLGPNASAGQVEAIACESAGNPLFIQELVQHLHREDAVPAPALTLDQVLWTRVERLPPEERRLLEVVAVAGRPLNLTLARQAAELETEERVVAARLRAARLLRGSGSAESDDIEIYHDRVRETVTAHLPPEALEALHARLASVLEASGLADPELLGDHLHQGGEGKRAGVCFTQAADQATEALAFDRAARLYRRVLELRTLHDEEERTLRIRLAEALANAGRGPEAAREYLAAAEDTSPHEALDLRRRAALRLLTCGHFQEGIDTIRPVLDAFGLGLPSSPARALWPLLLARLRLRLRGLRFTVRPEEQIDSEDIRYMDVCWSVGVGLFSLDPFSAWTFLTRALLRAMAVGDALRGARGLALEASFLVSGGRRSSRRAAAALEIAERLAHEGQHASVAGLVLLTRGMAAFSEGRWTAACELYDRSELVFREHGVGAAFEINLSRLYSLLALYYRGQIGDMGRRAARMYQEARERGDFLAMLFAGLIKLYAPLCADDLDGVRRGLTEIREQGPEQGVELLRHNVRIWQMNLDIYRGKGAAALAHLSEPIRAPEHALVRSSRHLRIPWHYKRASCFLAAAECAETTHAPALLIRSAAACARRLQGEKLPWADGLAGLIRAGVAACRDNRNEACAILREAIIVFESSGMSLHAAVARRRLGECLPDAEGLPLIDQATSAMTALGIRNPERMTALYAPGFGGGDAAVLAARQLRE